MPIGSCIKVNMNNFAMKMVVIFIENNVIFTENVEKCGKIHVKWKLQEFRIKKLKQQNTKIKVKKYK